MNDKTPKVSVVVPNYNYGRFLRTRLDTIFAQTLQDFELLILDDASTDDSRAIIELYLGDPRVRTQFKDHNTGNPFHQWNRGVAMARAEYVWIAEADDQASERLLETLVNRLDEQPLVGLAYCASLEMGENGGIGGRVGVPAILDDPERWHSDFVNDGRDEVARFLFIHNTIPNASAVVFRKSLFERTGGADESFQHAGDWAQWARMLLVSDVAYVATPLNYFRQHEQTVRSKHATSLVLETIRLQSILLRSLDVDCVHLRRGVTSVSARWLHLVSRGREGLPLAQHARILRMLMRLDLRHALYCAALFPIVFVRGVRE